MANHPSLPKTFPVLAVKVLCSKEPFTSKKPEVAGHYLQSITGKPHFTMLTITTELSLAKTIRLGNMGPIILKKKIIGINILLLYIFQRKMPGLLISQLQYNELVF